MPVLISSCIDVKPLLSLTFFFMPPLAKFSLTFALLCAFASPVQAIILTDAPAKTVQWTPANRSDLISNSAAGACVLPPGNSNSENLKFAYVKELPCDNPTYGN